MLQFRQMTNFKKSAKVIFVLLTLAVIITGSASWFHIPEPSSRNPEVRTLEAVPDEIEYIG